MKARFLFPAEEELDETINYYNYQIPGLGNQFYEEVNQAINRIIKFPNAWTKVGKHARRCLLRRFPYALLYSIENSAIIILAVANLHRNPEYYRDRIR